MLHTSAFTPKPDDGFLSFPLYEDDRFIPNRDGLDLATSFTLLPGGSGSNNTSGSSTPNSGSRGGKRKTANVDSDAQTGAAPVSSPLSVLSPSSHPGLPNADKDPRWEEIAEEANKTFDSLLRSELFGPSSIDNIPLLRSPSSARTSQYTAITSPGRASPGGSAASTKPLFNFTSPSRKRIAREDPTGNERGLDSPTHERYSLSPVRHESQRLLMSPRKPVRQVSKVPFKVSEFLLLPFPAVPILSGSE